MKTLLTICFITFLLATSSFPWGEEGHQAVGEAASAMLRPHARQIIKGILGSDDLASASLWLDNVRAAARHHTGPLKNDPETRAFNTKFPDNATWHFVNLPVGFSDYQLNGPFSSRNDIVHALRRAIAVLE